MNHCRETVDGLIGYDAGRAAGGGNGEVGRSDRDALHLQKVPVEPPALGSDPLERGKVYVIKPGGERRRRFCRRRHHDLRMCDHGGEYLDCRMPVIAKLHRRLAHTSPAAERAHPSPRPAYTRGAEAARTLEREAGRPKATLRQSRGTGFDPGSYCL
jgi:hypothetical protein